MTKKMMKLLESEGVKSRREVRKAAINEMETSPTAHTTSAVVLKLK
jgi:hypothetical protein